MLRFPNCGSVSASPASRGTRELLVELVPRVPPGAEDEVVADPGAKLLVGAAVQTPRFAAPLTARTSKCSRQCTDYPRWKCPLDLDNIHG